MSTVSETIIPHDSLFSDTDASQAEWAGNYFEESIPTEYQIHWQRDMLEQFLRNQLKLAPSIPLVALGLSMTALLWCDFANITPWLFGVTASNLIQLLLCKIYFRASRGPAQQCKWVAIMMASEFMQAIFWIVPLFLLGNDNAVHKCTFLVTAIMAVNALRFLIVSNFLPVLIAGTGTVTVGVALHCIFAYDPFYISLGGILIMLEVCFLFVACKLQETARDMIIHRNKKDVLIKGLRHTNEAAERERRKANQANQAKSSFLANMSHELRTPLNAILGFSEILQREMFGPINKTYKGYALDIYTSGHYLLGLINDILDISRIEAGHHEITEEPLNLLEPITQARHLLETKALQKNIAISIDVPANLPEVMADARGIKQVMINLLTNAIKFTPRNGKILLGAKRLPDGGLQLSVQDNGPGIPQEELEYALCAFTRGRMAITKAIDGAGLGLSIVKGIMRLHGGRVDIESTQGLGTKVTCTFPQRRVLSGPRIMLQGETQRRLVKITA